MLTPYRRHLKSCPFKPKGIKYTMCDCPIWVDGKKDGKRFRRSLDTSDWPTAATRLKRVEAGEEMTARVNHRGVGTAINAYLESCRRKNLRVTTVALYDTVLHQVFAAILDTPLAAITTRAVQAAMDARSIRPSTKFLEGTVVRIFFRWCVKQKFISETPAADLSLPKNESAPTMPFTQDEVSAMLAACEQVQGAYDRARVRALLLLLIYSGLRIGDAASLRRSALDISTGYLTLRVMKTRVPLKVKLAAEAVESLRRLPVRHPDYFFWDGKQPIKFLCQYLRQALQRLGKLAGIEDARPHRGRDTFACELLLSGADIRTVQLLLGHKTVQTTEKSYAHFVASHQNLLDSATARLAFGARSAPVLMHAKKG